MKMKATLLAAAVLAASAFAATPSSADSITGIGSARVANAPGVVQLNEGRSYYGYRRYYRPYYRPAYRPYYRAYRPRYFRYGY